MISNLINFFRRRKQGYSSPWLQVTVLYGVAANSLEPEDAFVLRGKVIAARPIQFEFVDGSGYLVFFPGDDMGLAAANQLAETLRSYAHDKSIPAFGVVVKQGECLAQISASGRFVGKPAGSVIAQAKQEAMAIAVGQGPSA